MYGTATKSTLIAILLVLVGLQPAIAQGRRGQPQRGQPQRGETARGGARSGGPEIPEGVQTYLNLAYVPNGHGRQRLNLYIPEKGQKPVPLIIWIHGGGWFQGNKDSPTAVPLTTRGFAVASIDYRFSQHALFPAQIEDCKAAIRWLRANAAPYNLDPERFAAWGSSAGGHLAALVGTTGDVPEFDTGQNLDQTSRVQAVVDWFGPTDFLQMGGSHNEANSPESQLIGGPIQKNREKASKANPIAYIGNKTPPFLIMHGTNDRSVPFSQSELLTKALKKANVEVAMIALKGARHGDPAFTSTENMVEKFLTRHLLAK